MTNFFIQASGWIGTSLFVLTYFLISSKRLDATSRTFQYLNLLGAFGVGVNVFYERAWPAFALEVIWASIAVWTLLRKP